MQLLSSVGSVSSGSVDASCCLVDGRWGSTLSILDRGLNYGDGVFETIAVVAGKLRHWTRHMRRLQLACSFLSMDMPPANTLLAEAHRLIFSKLSPCCVIKIVVTRGISERGYFAPRHNKVTRILRRSPWPNYSKSNCSFGIKARSCQTTLSHNLFGGIKHLNRLEQVIARSEWDEPGIAEGLMFDRNGFAIEGTMSNLFLVANGQLYTANLQHCGVAGIVREIIIDVARAMGIKCNVTDISRASLLESDELFVCNSLIGIWPIRELDGRRYPLGEITLEIIGGLERAQ